MEVGCLYSESAMELVAFFAERYQIPVVTSLLQDKGQLLLVTPFLGYGWYARFIGANIAIATDADPL